MEYERRYLLWLAGCGARGEAAPRPQSPVDWERLLSEAEELKIRPFAAGAVKKQKNEICPSEIKAQLSGEVIRQAVKYHCGMKKVEELQKGLKGAGISSAVMKGYALSSAYGVPELRMGQDVDLYVAPGQERQAISWLTENGWRLLGKRGWCANHSELKREDFGILELHTKLHSKYAGIYFRNRRVKKGVWNPLEPFRQLDTVGGICALGISDHFVFIWVHLFRHLLELEVTVRMILDMAAFLDTYRDSIDWERVWGVMADLKCEKLFSTILAAAETYFGYALPDRKRMEIPLMEQERLMELFCGAKEGNPYDRVRLRWEYNRLGRGGRLESLRYRLFALTCYLDDFERRVKKYGVFGYLWQGMKKTIELMGGEREIDKAVKKHKTQASDDTFLLLQDMELL